MCECDRNTIAVILNRGTVLYGSQAGCTPFLGEEILVAIDSLTLKLSEVSYVTNVTRVEVEVVSN